MNRPLYRLDKVSLGWSGQRLAVDRLSLRIDAGERVVLLGANGSGKTSLLKLLNALVLPDRGTLSFEGHPLDARRIRQRDWNRAFRRRVVLLFQQPEAMLFNPTVADEIGYGLSHLDGAIRLARIEHWARRLNLLDLLDASPPDLSGGEKQRLCLACLLAIEPEVLLLDEPTANLDPRTAGWLLDWLAGQAITTVIATHQLGLATELGERALILSDRHRLVFDGPVHQALADTELLLANGLAHAHVHRHPDEKLIHHHPHVHDWV